MIFFNSNPNKLEIPIFNNVYHPFIGWCYAKYHLSLCLYKVRFIYLVYVGLVLIVNAITMSLIGITQIHNIHT